MGANQSSGAGGGSRGSAPAEVKTSYYELLGVERSATDDEIKKAYRRKALELHPDRNYGNVEWATELFAEVQAAYEVLSDPHERAWYDSHEAQILRGADAMDGGGGGEHYEHNMRVTTADEVAGMMRRFNARIEFSDAPSGFFGFLRETFEKLAREEEAAASWDGLEPIDYPSFGHRDDVYDDVVRSFYAVWQGFSTRKTFAWKEIYRYSEAPDRRYRRLMEKENKRLREEGIREFNDAVRQLVAFVRKRDPRYKPVAQTEEQMRASAAAQAARARAANEAKLDYVVPEWATARDQEELEESEEEDQEEEEFECVACRKVFKSENQYEAHEKSKKHQKAVYALQKKMRKDNAHLDLDDAPSSAASGAATPDVESEAKAIPEDQSEDEEVDEPTQKANDGLEKLDLEGTDGSLDDEAKIATPPVDAPPSAAEPAATPKEPEISDSDEDDKATSAPTEDISIASKDDGNEDNEPKATEESLAEDDDDASSTAPKMGKAAQKRAKKAAQREAAEQEGLTHKCASCNAGFPSKTRLFQHISDFGHAAPVTQVAAGGSGGKKTAGKKKKKK